MQKVIICELTDHYEYIYSVCRIMEYGNNKLSFFVRAPVAREMKIWLGKDYDKHSWIIKEENESLLFFMIKLRQYIKSQCPNIVIFCTPPSVFSLAIVADTKYNMILTIHNVNNWLNDNPTTFLQKVQKLLRGYVLGKISSIAVLEENLVYYIVTHKLWENKLYVFPYEIYEPYYSPPNTDANRLISFIVPGTIQRKRKDYELILDTFEKLFKIYSNVSLTLLGTGSSDYARLILGRCEQLKNQGYNVNYYSDFVSKEEFELRMKQCDCVIAPICVNFEGLEYQEVYGTTKSTGSVFDMIRYAKPGVFPLEYNEPANLRNSIMKYQDPASLYGILETLITTEKLRELQANATTNSKQYLAENFRERSKQVVFASSTILIINTKRMTGS